MWDEYLCATNIDEVIHELNKQKGQIRIIAGATDLILEMEHKLHPEIHSVVDITRIKGLDQISLDETGVIHIGPLVTHNHCVSSELIRKHAYPLARACWEIGAPQIRNRGTIAGNLITASPANDTITPLIALDSVVTLQSVRGKRIIQLTDFYKGVRKTIMEPDEMLVDISFKSMQDNQRGSFIKLALRRAQAISIVNVAALLTFEGETIRNASITLGAVAPTIIHAKEAENFLVGKKLKDGDVISQAALLAMNESKPIDDIRASARYRKEMVRILIIRILRKFLLKKEDDEMPEKPVLLWGKIEEVPQKESNYLRIDKNTSLRTNINGNEYSFEGIQGKTLLQLLRDDAGLVGSKEGCGEGECGACTVFLDGKAVMACLVPAGRAEGAEIITIEGLAKGNEIHLVQEAFIEEGAVQCGYCTPGFIMSSAKLLEEIQNPSRNQILQALTGNLCRCTGYYKIISAIENASAAFNNQ